MWFSSGFRPQSIWVHGRPTEFIEIEGGQGSSGRCSRSLRENVFRGGPSRDGSWHRFCFVEKGCCSGISAERIHKIMQRLRKANMKWIRTVSPADDLGTISKYLLRMPRYIITLLVMSRLPCSILRLSTAIALILHIGQSTTAHDLRDHQKRSLHQRISTSISYVPTVFGLFPLRGEASATTCKESRIPWNM